MATSVPGVSIGIVFHNEGERILRCLNSLGAAYSEHRKISDLPVEFLFVDNQSKMNCSQLVKNFCLKNRIPFQVFLNDTNNMGKARDRITYAAKYEHLIFLDADCVPEKNWIGKFLEVTNTFKGDKWAVVGGENKPPQTSEILYHCQNLLKKSPLLFLNSTQLLPGKDIKKVYHVPTCNALYRTESIKKVGGFNHLFDHVGEDLELSARLLRDGKEIYFADGVAVEHFDKTEFKSWFTKVFRYGTVQPRVLLAFPRHTNPLRWTPLFLLFLMLILASVSPVVFIGVSIAGMIFVPVITAFAGKNLELLLPWMVFLNGTVIFYSLGYVLGLYKIVLRPSVLRNANLSDETGQAGS